MVHSDEMKMHILLKKVKVDFLVSIKSSVNIELSKVPMTFTYTQALTAYRNTVNQRHPPDLINNNRGRSRHINEQNTG